MITIACCLWTPTEGSFDFSRMYDERWVEKLYRGFARNLSRPFRFACLSDEPRAYTEKAIQDVRLRHAPGYHSLIEPFRLEGPLMIVGLDTVVVGNCDDLVAHAERATRIAAPRDPFYPDTVCNGLLLVPKGCTEVYHEHQRAGGQGNDMETIRALYRAGEIDVIDDLFPGQVVSYKGHVRDYGLGEARVVYFHGRLKPHELESHVPWIADNWT